jgi:hypothetical protein
VAGKTVLKFRFDVRVVVLENLPLAVKQCRVVWARSAKLQLTDVVSTSSGLCAAGSQQSCLCRTYVLWAVGSSRYNQDLTQVATMYKDAKGQFEPKVGCVCIYWCHAPYSFKSFRLSARHLGDCRTSVHVLCTCVASVSTYSTASLPNPLVLTVCRSTASKSKSRQRAPWTR